MAGTATTIRLDAKLADEAVRLMNAKSRTAAIHLALLEIVGPKGFKELIKKYSLKIEPVG